MTRKILPLLIATTFSASLFAAPSALIEDISAAGVKLQMFDFVSPGDSMDLGENGSVSLGYMNSCTYENITGGKVTVGANQSEVTGGNVERTTSQCDGGQLLLAADQASKSGAMAIRDKIDTTTRLIVMDTSPLLLLSKSSRVKIKRLENDRDRGHQSGERYTLRLPKSDERAAVDLTEHHIELAPGGRYMITVLGGTSMVFEVHPNATHGDVPVLSRVIPL